MAVVIYSSTDGIFLGSWMGIEMWSKYDATHTSKAVTFTNIDEASEHIATWDGGDISSISVVDISDVKTEDLVFVERFVRDSEGPVACSADEDRLLEVCIA